MAAPAVLEVPECNHQPQSCDHGSDLAVVARFPRLQCEHQRSHLALYIDLSGIPHPIKLTRVNKIGLPLRKTFRITGLPQMLNQYFNMQVPLHINPHNCSRTQHQPNQAFEQVDAAPFRKPQKHIKLMNSASRHLLWSISTMVWRTGCQQVATVKGFPALYQW